MAKVISKIVLGGASNDIHDARIKNIEEYPTATDHTSVVSSKGVIDYVANNTQTMYWQSLSSRITPTNAKAKRATRSTTTKNKQ